MTGSHKVAAYSGVQWFQGDVANWGHIVLKMSQNVDISIASMIIQSGGDFSKVTFFIGPPMLFNGHLSIHEIWLANP